MDPREHWDAIYRKRAPSELSGFEPTPETSFELIGTVAPQPEAVVLEVGGGASALVAGLLDRGYRDITVVDLSGTALTRVRERLGARGASVRLLESNVLTLELGRPVDVWHDRAVFHFLTAEEDRSAYLETLRDTLRPGGHVVLATFALDGPEKCSGLPVVRYSPETLGGTLGPDYRLVQALARAHVTPNRKEQRFTYAVFQREG
jgi:SAM-dependent methyltransferase